MGKISRGEKMMKQGMLRGRVCQVRKWLVHLFIHSFRNYLSVYQEADPALVNRIVEVKFTDRLILTEHIFQGTLW